MELREDSGLAWLQARVGIVLMMRTMMISDACDDGEQRFNMNRTSAEYLLEHNLANSPF